MKRAKQLQPLSREHHLGLVISRHARDCVDDVEAISEHWLKLNTYLNTHMENHFNVEDDLILAKLEPYKQDNPKVAEVIDTLDTQHKNIYALIEPESLSASHVRKLGDALYEHIRYEEREVFPLVETVLSEQELDAIYDASSDNAKRKAENR